MLLLVMAWLSYTSCSAASQIQSINGVNHEIEMINPQVFAPTDILGIHQFFGENGFVVIDDVSHVEHRNAVVEQIDRIAQDTSIPNARRLGFMDLYHDDSLAQIRQDPRLHYIFATLFNDPRLWVVFDRVMYWGASEGESNLPPHVDQNPINNPGFYNVQGMLALRDMNEGTGTLALVPKSLHEFQNYAQWAKPRDGFIEHQGVEPLHFVAVRLKEGQIIIWDSRTTHSRFRGEPTSNRYAALITYTPAVADPELMALRLKYFQEGVGWSNYQAGLRATARPRCEISLRSTPERLTPLGRKLYGLESW